MLFNPLTKRICYMTYVLQWKNRLNCLTKSMPPQASVLKSPTHTHTITFVKRLRQAQGSKYILERKRKFANW